MTLALLSDSVEPEKFPIRSLVIAYRKAYAENMGRESNMTWGSMIGRIKHKFETTDEETGEVLIEYPSQKIWEDEVAGFFANEYAKMRNPAFPFDLFLKQFGNYTIVTPQKRKPKMVLSQWETCDKCAIDFPKGQRCPKCNP